MVMEVSTRLQERITEGMSGDETGLFKAYCTLSNPDTGYSYTCRYVNSIDFVQDFLNAYTDNIQVSIDITPSELREILENVSGMQCSLVLYGVDESTGDIIYTQDPVIYEMKVLISEQVDIDKKYPASAFADPDTGEYLYPEQASAMFPYTFHLIEPDAYAVRHVQINSMFNTATMEQILHWACQQFGATKVKVIPPDNTMSYSNVVIPAMHDISSLFPFLQQRHGVYAKGLGYYFCESTMYIYPAWDTTLDKNTTTDTLHIVNAPQGQYSGNRSYHNYSDNELTIVSTTKTELKNLASEGSENMGNVHMSVNAGQMRDNFVTVDSTGKVSRSADDITILGPSNNSCNIQSDMQNIKYVGERSNIYISTSEMAAFDGILLATGWTKAIPRRIKPGQCLKYHFDSQAGIYGVQKGRIVSVRYSSQAYPSDSYDNWLSFTAFISAKLDSEVESDT